ADADVPGDVAATGMPAEPAPLHAALAPSATAAPGERLADDFWVAPLLGTGAGDSGEGSDGEDSPSAVAGDDVAKVIYKRDGAAWIDLAVADERAERGDSNQVNVTRTALGTWFVPVDDLVRATWTWPEAEKALGVRGRVVVEFTIAVDGRVSDVALVDANVPLSMQEAALAAIPAAVAPPPEGEGPLRVRYVFRYGD
ncbi:MAG: TonB family protein, partial [Deltaproteobacteria bacterium]|nr:TonB family protein [Deltaproteobacteria bacterium]